MTGRDLIIYILQNHLEDEEVFKDGKFLDFMTESEAAVEFGVNVPTVKIWISLGMLEAVKLGENFYIPTDAEILPEKLKERSN